ncbi:hypothetical protein A3H09_03815 [Candidatus Falkowbacteria bacterium RIFCSPLOWO2_12_FULL_45_13]|uniref:UDP-N-acetylglucosamine--N-acetylmuramyl-(pentapeptide) pyrophosphoryl-undecaprenol N-acetylglucosamine transferase n=1 Tax=Candidatus Falkowbacteria bacterium RIFCSPLOWO2_12_FULL_45_13 TaxID=1797991 RepID=A0A1F5SUR8_9BACT|nr:MAG: hypothetical protein A3H09_03815 [Candidatus Falkowbacteria bacterium RIFCSPLOWO2_12_FULL_45_13]
MNNEKKYKILLSGGGTGGSVAPLLAVAEELETSPLPPPLLSPPLEGGKHSSPEEEKAASGQPSPSQGEGRVRLEFLWLGTKYGPERAMVENAGIKFKAISGGKWRRYFSFKNFSDIFKIKLAFWQAFFIMLKWRPNLVMSAGSFISVPVVWAAWILRVPVIVHQQDVRPGLANKLMAPLAKIITVSFEKSLADYGKKAVWTGNPVRGKKLEVRSKNYNNFGLSGNLPVVLIVGGGTGAMAINKLVEESLSELTKFCQIIHVTGKNKSKKLEVRSKNYATFEFLDAGQMAEALHLADAVVTRAGMGALSELSYLKKPAIIIPMPGSHQVDNAQMFKEAAVVLEQKDLTPEKFASEIINLLNDKKLQKRLGEKIGRVMKRGAEKEMVMIIRRLLTDKKIK